MYKNQLQELAQRSCFNLPAYSCIREGPDHAPRFKATVNFNGEVFESPTYCSTLRQAEHAAAEVALTTLSRRGPSRSLAARILDETGVFKNLLQEAAQRAGVSLPVYTTIRSGPGHLPVFRCIVEVDGRTFAGEVAKTKKQAEKNAAMAAWSAIKQLTSYVASSSQTPLLLDSEAYEELERSSSNAITTYRRDERTSFAHNAEILSAQLPTTRNFRGHSGVRVVNVRDRNRMAKDGSSCGQFVTGSSSSGEGSFDAGQSHGGYPYCQQPTSTLRPAVHQRALSVSGVDSQLPSREGLAASRVAGGGAGGNAGRVMLLPQRRGPLPQRSRTERFELRQPLEEGLHQREEDDLGRVLAVQQRRGMPLRSHSERFELKQPVEELYQREEDDLGRRMLGLPMRSHSERFQLKQPLEDLYRREDDSMGRVMSMRGLPLRSQSERYEVKPFMEELYQREEEEMGRAMSGRGLPLRSSGYRERLEMEMELKQKQQQQQQQQHQHVEELHQRDDEEWLRGGEMMRPNVEMESSHGYGDKSSYAGSSSSSSSIWSRSAQWWGSHLPSNSAASPSPSPSPSSLPGANPFANPFSLMRPVSSLAPPVRVRQMVAVHSAPPPRRPDIAPAPLRPPPQPLRHAEPSPGDGEVAARQLFSQLRL